MTRSQILGAACFLLAASLAFPALAQAVRDSNEPIPGGTDENVGSVDEDARYQAENRQLGDFVGADIAEGIGFVGRSAGEPVAIESAISGSIIRRPPTPSVNLIRAESIMRTSGMYAPQLQLGGFTFPRRTEPAIEEEISVSLRRSFPSPAGNSISVAVEFGTATLTGIVQTPEAKKVAELMTLLEPGVSRVNNQLTIAPLPPEPLSLPPTR